MKHDLTRHILWLILAIALMAALTLCAVGCAGTTSPPTDTTGATAPPTDAPTEGLTAEIPDEQPTTNAPETDVPATDGQTQPPEAPVATADVETIPATEPETEPQTEPETDPPEVDKLVIQAFERGDPNDFLTSLDWTGTQWGITNPILDAADKETDLGRGLMVVLTSNAVCQYMSATDVNEFFSHASEYTYLRFWICNRTGGAISIGVVYEGTNVNAASDGDAILTYRCDGQELIFNKNDASGMGSGHNTAVAIPDNFEGWVAFPLTALTANWGAALPPELAGTDKITLDVRPVGFDGNGYYVLDELALTNSPFGERRKASGTSIMTSIEEKRTLIEDTYTRLLDAQPVVTYVPEFDPTMSEYAHIKAITYEGLDKSGQKTKVFAYIGYPEGASPENPVPGIVLVHGGGGHAYLPWIKMWNDRGYAAIAMDNTGYFPIAVNAGEFEVTQGFGFGLSGIFVQEGYTGAPNNDDMASSDGKVENMWMYHAVGQTIIANNILRADPCVAGDKIGVTGISWGGVITSIAIGWDNRFAFAIPIYGSAYLTESRAWMHEKFSGEATQALWSAADRYDKMTVPTLWLAWNDDSCFSVNSNSMSYLTSVRKNSLTRLSMINQMMHSHSCGWNPAESMIFADSIVKGTPHMPDFATQPSGRTVDVRLNVEEDVTIRKVKVYYITEPQTYSRHEKYGYTDTFMDQIWKTKELTYDKATGRITGDIPADAAAYYLEVTAGINKKAFVICSSFVELE